MKNEDMPWINTYSGRVAYPLNPEVTQYSIGDIAHSLAMQCRWNGHCKQFYSVAQHSVHGADLLGALRNKRHFLMHDAPEYVLKDIPSPIKKTDEFRFYRSLEERTEMEIFHQFGVKATPMTHAVVHNMDISMLVREHTLLMNKVPDKEWGFDKFDSKWIDEHLPVIPYWPPERAEAEFLNRFTELFYDQSK